MSPATKWSLICVSEAGSGGSCGEADFCHVSVGVLWCSGAPVLICQMVRIASENTCLIFKNHIHLSHSGSLSVNKCPYCSSVLCFLLLKNFIDGKKSFFCGPVNKLKMTACIEVGSLQHNCSALNSCFYNFCLVSKELVFHHEDTRGFFYRIALCQWMTNMCVLSWYFMRSGNKKNKGWNWYFWTSLPYTFFC